MDEARGSIEREYIQGIKKIKIEGVVLHTQRKSVTS